MHTQSAAKWYQVESEQLGRSLSVQAAKLVAMPLVKEDQSQLSHYVTLINQGMFVKEAALFDELGVRYAQREEPLSIVQLMTQSDVEPLVFVEDIVYEGDTRGYIKLVLDKQAITAHHQEFNQNQLSQSILMVVLSIVAACLATRLFYTIRNSYKFSEGDDSHTL